MKLRIIVLVTVLIICGFGVYTTCNVEKGLDTFLPDTVQSDYENVLIAPPIPDNIGFCGEMVPLHLYWVKEGLDRELINHCYNHSRTLLTLKRSTRFFPEIEKILNDENVPLDLKYLCVAESNLENVVSPAKAAGFWQFIEATGKNYGLEINEIVDERYHLEKATRAACKHLRKLKEQFGDWALAAAAYNMGENGLSKRLNEQQLNNYWNLYLNEETSRYVYRCVAYKLIFENQELYNIHVFSVDYYKPIDFKEIVVTKSIDDLINYCTDNKILYRQLKELNPWLRSSRLTISANKNYTLRVPN